MLKILIAEDEAVARKLLERYLQQWGYETTVAQDGEDAWALFQQGDYPIVITDWMMPRADGLEVIRRIRQSELADCVYTILLSARSQKEDLVEGMEAGADDFVSKPFDRDELRVRLREAERIVRLERELAAQNKRLEDGRETVTERDGAAVTPAGVVQAIHEPLDELAINLTTARRELSAFRNVVNSYRDACQRLSGSQPDVRAELAQLDSQFECLNLDGLLDRMVASLEQVGDILKNLQQRAAPPEQLPRS